MFSHCFITCPDTLAYVVNCPRQSVVICSELVCKPVQKKKPFLPFVYVCYSEQSLCTSVETHSSLLARLLFFHFSSDNNNGHLASLPTSCADMFQFKCDVVSPHHTMPEYTGTMPKTTFSCRHSCVHTCTMLYYTILA